MTTEKKLDITKYKFPNVSDLDIVFPTYNTDPILLAEAKLRGMDMYSNPYNKLASILFFEGGSLKFKQGIDEEFRVNALRYFKALIGSFAPKHEHKTAVCALILSEIAEPELA